MKITPEEVEKIGKLAKIVLSKEEIPKMSKDLSSILEYVKTLDELDTKNIEPTAQITGLLNIRRKDKVDYNFAREDMLASAPEVQDDLIKVKKIFE